jgi:Smg protein
MTGTVLDILIYVFDHYMLAEAPQVPERDDLARALERAGFAAPNVERALDWLADLADVRHRPALHGQQQALRVFSDCELVRLSTPCRNDLLHLERVGVLSPEQREIVIERLLALEAADLEPDHLRWVVLMVLSSQPGQEQAFARMETLVADAAAGTPH